MVEFTGCKPWPCQFSLYWRTEPQVTADTYRALPESALDSPATEFTALRDILPRDHALSRLGLQGQVSLSHHSCATLANAQVPLRADGVSGVAMQKAFPLAVLSAASGTEAVVRVSDTPGTQQER